jgi:hypothetical protein
MINDRLAVRRARGVHQLVRGRRLRPRQGGGHRVEAELVGEAAWDGWGVSTYC